MESQDTIRLNKFISDSGFCSRREADKLIEQGRVTINGRLGVLGDRVSSTDIVSVDGKNISKEIQEVFIAFNKPRGITCTTELHVKDNIIEYIHHPLRIFPIGRLDKDSEGLIFLTNDGNMVNKILRAGNNHEKEYEVTVDKPFDDDFIHQMSNGVPILDTITQKCKVVALSKTEFKIILTQGLNRQIRRMCEYLGYQVKSLKRIRIMNITLKGIPKGSWRDLTLAEMNEIQQLVANSVKTEEASIHHKKP